MTQQSGGELDYMVASRDMGALGLLYQGHIPGGFSADHYLVEFGVVPIRGAAGFSIGSYSNRSDQERILDVYNNNSANGTHIITYDPLGGRQPEIHLRAHVWRWLQHQEHVHGQVP